MKKKTHWNYNKNKEIKISIWLNSYELHTFSEMSKMILAKTTILQFIPE